MALHTRPVCWVAHAALAALVAAAGPALAQAPQPAAPTQTAATPAAAPAQPAPAKTARAPKKKAAPTESAETEAPAAPAKRDPAEAIRQVDGGIKLLQANKAEQAVQTLSVAIASGVLPSAHMARALYHRGVGYRKTAKPAQAISDLTSALYVKNGLPDPERQDALKQRADAYREAGLPDQTSEDGRVAGSSGAKRGSSPGTGSTGAAAVTTSSLAPDNATPTAAPTSGGLFAQLFGGIGKSQPKAPEPRQVAPAEAAAPAPAQPATSAWSSATSVRPARTASATAPAPVATPAAPTPPAASAAVPAAAPAKATKTAAAGAFQARIALVRSEGEAQPIVQKLKSQHGAALAGKDAALSSVQFGGMGSFVQVSVGPYTSKAEADAFCGRLKGSGLDCVAVSH